MEGVGEVLNGSSGSLSGSIDSSSGSLPSSGSTTTATTNNGSTTDNKGEEEKKDWLVKATKLASNRELRSRNSGISYDEVFEEEFEWIEEVEFDETQDKVGAESAAIPPFHMTEFEKKHFPSYSKRPNKIATFLSIRNHILTLWEKSKTEAFLTKEIATANVKRSDFEIGQQIFEFLERYGFINFGTVPKPFRNEQNNHDIIVVGAGMAGIAAARQLYHLGYNVIVLEARDRVGGRMYTDRSFTIGVDLGASVVTGMRGNPISTACEQLNIPLHKISEHCPLYDPNGHLVSSDLDKKLEVRFNNLLERAHGQKGPQSANQSLGDTFYKVVEQENISPENLALLNWHVANLEYACAADLSKVSLNEWDQDDGYEFEGDHCLVPKGYSTIPEEMAKELDIRLKKVVKTIDYSKSDILIQTEEGEKFTCKHVLVTLPLGVLQKSDVMFVPPLPDWKVEAIKRLGFGLLNKIALQFPKVFWNPTADYFAHTTSDGDKRGEFFLFWDMKKCMNAPILVGLIAGQVAHDVEKEEPEVVLERALKVLKDIFGTIEQPEKYVVTKWASDPYAYGSYSYIVPGGTGADYDTLAKPVGSKLFFAGEATNRFHPATVAGAFVSGLRVAGVIDRTIKMPRGPKKFKNGNGDALMILPSTEKGQGNGKRRGRKSKTLDLTYSGSGSTIPSTPTTKKKRSRKSKTETLVNNADSVPATSSTSQTSNPSSDEKKAKSPSKSPIKRKK